MVDSNNFGKYSDVCYRDALAGDKLVGNNNKPFGDLLNFLVWGAAQTVNVVLVFIFNMLIVTIVSPVKEIVDLDLDLYIFPSLSVSFYF